MYITGQANCSALSPFEKENIPYGEAFHHNIFGDELLINL